MPTIRPNSSNETTPTHNLLEHISKSSVHCSRYTDLKINPGQTTREINKESDWKVVDDELKCPEHHS